MIKISKKIFNNMGFKYLLYNKLSVMEVMILCCLFVVMFFSSAGCIKLAGGKIGEDKLTGVLDDKLALENDTVRFSGYNWKIKHSNGLVGPGPNYFSNSRNNVWVDKNGYLHLAIIHTNDIWTCVEVICESPVGYGRYIFVIAGQERALDPNVVFGLFTWDSSNYQKEANSEIDIEFSQWSDSKAPNLHYSVQPTCGPDEKSGIYRERTKAIYMPVRNCPAEHQFQWLPDKVLFNSGFKDVSQTGMIDDWCFKKNKLLRRSSCGDGISLPVGIPRPGSNTEIRFNLWLVDANRDKIPDAPFDKKKQEVVIKSFKYIPMQ